MVTFQSKDLQFLITECDEEREVACSIFISAHYLLGTLHIHIIFKSYKILQGEMNFYFYRHVNLSSERA